MTGKKQMVQRLDKIKTEKLDQDIVFAYIDRV